MFTLSRKNKQNIYSSLNARMLAALIDTLLLSLILYPIVIILDRLIYGSVTPGDIIRSILTEYNEMSRAGNQDTADILLHPRFYEYFIENHGFARVAISYSLQVMFAGTLIIVCWMKFASTPGKMLIRAKIVDAQTLEPVPTYRLIIRFFAYFISVLPLFLGVFWIGFSKKKQGWHDKIAGTVVISR